MTADLKMVTSQELVDELRSRTPNGFVLIRDGESSGDDPHDWYTHFGDNYGRSVALVHYAEWKLAQTFMRMNPMEDPSEFEQ